MTAPLTDARLAEIEALAASTYSGGDLHAARFIGALCADVRDLLAALAQCREEREEAKFVAQQMSEDNLTAVRQRDAATAALAAAWELLPLVATYLDNDFGTWWRDPAQVITEETKIHLYDYEIALFNCARALLAGEAPGQREEGT